VRLERELAGERLRAAAGMRRCRLRAGGDSPKKGIACAGFVPIFPLCAAAAHLPQPRRDGGGTTRIRRTGCLVSQSATATLPEVPTRRAVWRIALTAVIATTALIGLVIGGYMLYDAKTNEISDLKQQRQHLSATNETLGAEKEKLIAANGTLSAQLASTRTDLRKTDAQLAKTTKKLKAAKRDLRSTKQDLAAANDRADANYGAGYSAGNTEGYSQGNADGYSQGNADGYAQGNTDGYWQGNADGYNEGYSDGSECFNWYYC
jgi:hypothetical protein